jgi:hypothetical protein
MNDEDSLAEEASDIVAALIPDTIAVIVFTKTGYHVAHNLSPEVFATLTNTFTKEILNGD